MMPETLKKFSGRKVGMEVNRLIKMAVVVIFAVAITAPVAMAADWGNAPQTYKQYCASCHGATGHGDGSLGMFLNPKPRDFANCKIMMKITDKTLFNAIKGGGASVGISHNMPAWGGSLNDKQIKDMIKFVRHFCSKTAGK